MKTVRYALAFLPLVAFFSFQVSATHTHNQTLLNAILKQDTQEVQRLLASGTVDVNYQGNDCGIPLDLFMPPITSALHLAVYSNISLVKILLEAGADPNIRNEEQETPLHLLSFVKKELAPELFQLLIQAGADVNAQDNFQRSPLHRAVENKNYTVACLLLTAPNIDITLTDSDGRTALDSAHGYYVPTDEEAQYITEIPEDDENTSWVNVQKTQQENKQRMINLLTFDRTNFKATLINYIKTHRDQFTDQQLAQLPHELRELLNFQSIS